MKEIAHRFFAWIASLLLKLKYKRRKDSHTKVRVRTERNTVQIEREEHAERSVDHDTK